MVKRANGEGSVFFDESKGVWVGLLTIGRTADGRIRRRKFTGKTRKEARERLDAAVSKQRAGMPVPDERTTVGAFLRDWIARVVPGTVSEGTLDTYARVIRLYLLPAFDDVPLVKLTPAHVTDLLRRMEDRGLAGETRRMARAVLRRGLRRAEQEGLVVRNVAAIADGPSIRRAEGRTLSPDEARSLIAVSRSERLHASFSAALSLGLRRGEVLGLRWTDLDLDSSPPTARIVTQLQRTKRGLELVDVKTMRSRRRLHLPAPLVDDLRRHRSTQNAERLALGAEWRDTLGLVFTTPLGTPVDPRNFSRLVGELCQKAGIGHWSPHELRHSCASLLLAQGVPLEVVSEVLGHSSIRVTKDVYGHLLAPARAQAATAMQQTLWS